MLSIKTCGFFLILVSSFMAGCGSPTDTTKLNVDRNIPLSEAFDASYGFYGPDGETIYFTHSEKLGSDPAPGKLDQLWKLNLKTGRRTKIHDGRILNVDISPDGKWFVFHSFTSPEFLFKMRSNGSGLQKLTGPSSPNPTWEYTTLGRWAPNSKKILFSVFAGVPRGLALMDSNGRNPHIIMPFGIDGKWFPSGAKIVYLNFDTTQVRYKQEQIYIAQSDGTQPNKITNIAHSGYLGNIAEPNVSPNGQRIVFTNESQTGSGREVFIMNIAGRKIEQITAGPGYAARPEWRPDGQTILFSRIIPNVSKHLYYLDVATREVTPVFSANENTHN